MAYEQYDSAFLRGVHTQLTSRFGTKSFTRKQAATALKRKPTTVLSYFGAMSRAGMLVLTGRRGKCATYQVVPSQSETTSTSPAIILQLTLDGTSGNVKGTAVSGADFKAAQKAVGVARQQLQELQAENAELKAKLANVTKALALV